MSLINDALKKAQQRHSKGPSTPPPPTVSDSAPSNPPTHPADRNQPLPSQLFVLFALGAIVLIAFSVVATVYLLRRPAAPVAAQTPTAIVAQAPAVPAPPQEKINPSATVKTAPPASVTPPPVISLPAPQAATVVAPASQKPAAPSAPVIAPAMVSTPAAPTEAFPSATPVTPPELDPTKPDPKILAYLDALQITGIRLTSAGGKVLMNDRVYRENDIVDHLLGLRLKKIEPDVLTFMDERSVIYTKNF